MIVKKILGSIFPRSRRPVTMRAVIPLITFFVIFAGIVISLEQTDTLLFAKPSAFALSVFAVWVWWMHVAGFSGLSPVRAMLALTSRLVLLAAFIMLIAEPRAVRTRDVLSVVYAVDISDSIGDGSTDLALQFVTKTAQVKPDHDEAGLVVFGRNSAVELPPRLRFPFEAINSRIDRDATNLEQSLSLAAAMLPEENRGRIVLISDGTETQGNLAPVVDELKSRGISVDVLPIQYQYDDEVWVEHMELPQFVKIGENYEASIVLSSLKAGSGNVVLRENGEVIANESVEFAPGKNRYVFPIKLREPGYYEYTASIEVPRGKDHLRQNNTVINYIFVEGEGKVLVVTDPEGDQRDWESLVKAMRDGERVVDVQSAYEFPRDSLSLMPYDCVVLANVPADQLDAIQMQSLKDSVYNLGLGFLMVGGANSFGPGGYHRTVVEDALPVSMDVTKKKVLPKGALVIILHTCEFPEGNTWGKRITKQAVKVLGAQDEAGVLAYDYQNGEGWVFELTPVAEYPKLVPLINAAEIGDMPSFARTMRLGLDALKNSDAAAKHMIIISDGDPQPPAPSLIKEYQEAQVSVSMVAIFPHGGADISKMRSIASVTGGRYYFPADPSLLPSIFIKESKTLKRSMIQNKTVQPEVQFDSSVLKGINAIPPVHGYVLTTAKPRAETILKVAAGEVDEGEIDPILVIGQHGLGKSAAFTSDLSTNWGKDWVGWDKYVAFVKQLMTNISRVRKEGHLRMWNYTTGSEAVIIVEDFHPDESFLDVKARISGPREKVESVSLKQIGPRRYQASVPLWGKGRYQIMAAGVAGERTERALGGVIVPYSPEYLRFRSNPIMLKEIAEKTGGLELTADSGSDVIYGRRQPKQSTRPIFDWFLIALACLIPVDVGLRRVQLDWSVIKAWFGAGQPAGPSSATMGTLLQRKQAVHSELTSRREQPAVMTPRAGSPTSTKPTSERRSNAPPKAPPTSAGSEAENDPQSTTERLLAMKRRRRADDDE